VQPNGVARPATLVVSGQLLHRQPTEVVHKVAEVPEVDPRTEGIPRLETIVGAQLVALQFLEAMVLADFVGYWLHRVQHRWPWLWRWHAVHHSSTKVDWLAGGRNHPLEGVIARTLTIAPLFLAGFVPVVYAMMGPVLGLWGVLLHANVDWDLGRRWGK
jgi:sterol desaturase/sphingolipid hydroxylase (fatty acid hydroxylase superfamily)